VKGAVERGLAPVAEACPEAMKAVQTEEEL